MQFVKGSDQNSDDVVDKKYKYLVDSAADMDPPYMPKPGAEEKIKDLLRQYPGLENPKDDIGDGVTQYMDAATLVVTINAHQIYSK